MVQLVAFRNGEGNIGFFQKDGNDVSYYVNTNAALYSVMGANSWQSWVQQVEAGYANGDKEVVTKESIKYFLHHNAESISDDIVEMEEFQRQGSFYPRINRENIFFNNVV